MNINFATFILLALLLVSGLTGCNEDTDSDDKTLDSDSMTEDDSNTDNDSDKSTNSDSDTGSNSNSDTSEDENSTDSGEVVDCDAAADGCWSGEMDCWHCAVADLCKVEEETCNSNDDCLALSACIEDCPGEGWQECHDKCHVDFSDGSAALKAMWDCVYCDVCITSCAGNCIAQ